MSQKKTGRDLCTCLAVGYRCYIMINPDQPIQSLGQWFEPITNDVHYGFKKFLNAEIGQSGAPIFDYAQTKIWFCSKCWSTRRVGRLATKRCSKSVVPSVTHLCYSPKRIQNGILQLRILVPSPRPRHWREGFDGAPWCVMGVIGTRGPMMSSRAIQS